MSKVNMAVNIAGVEWKNPITVASGTFGSGMEYGEYVDLNKLGAVVTKGVATVPWPGNPTPRIAETYGGMINAVGLQNPGLDTFIKRDIPFLKQYDTKIIVNVCGKSKEDYVEAVERLAEQPVDMLEINISCPNVKEGGIAFGQNPNSSLAAEVRQLLDAVVDLLDLVPCGLAHDAVLRQIEDLLKDPHRLLHVLVKDEAVVQRRDGGVVLPDAVELPLQGLHVVAGVAPPQGPPRIGGHVPAHRRIHHQIDVATVVVLQNFVPFSDDEGDKPSSRAASSAL